MAAPSEEPVERSRSGRPGSAVRTTSVWLLPAAVLAVVVGVLAALAQHAGTVALAELGIDDPEDYSLIGHVLAMVLLGSLAVAVAASLSRARNPIAAAFVLLGTAFGPMTLVATTTGTAAGPASPAGSTWACSPRSCCRHRSS